MIVTLEFNFLMFNAVSKSNLTSSKEIDMTR